MAYAFADLLATMHIWFSGIPAPATTTTAQPSSAKGRLYGDRRVRAFDVRYQPTIDLVERSIRRLLAKERRAKTPTRSVPADGRPTQAELASAFDQLFALPDLASLAADHAAEARAALERAAAEADWARDRELAYAAYAYEQARIVDDEEAIALLLLAS